MAQASVSVSKRFSRPGSRRAASAPGEGIKVDTVFCPEDVADPFDTVEWEMRTAAIKGEAGEVLFEQTDCEVPAGWSQLATNVVCSKYFYGEVGTPEREKSVRQLIHRVSRTICRLGNRGRLLRHAPTTASDSIAICPGSACISTGRSIRPSGSTSACSISTASRARSAIGTGTPRRSEVQPAREPVRISARLGLLHPKRARTTWKTSWSSPAARPCCSSSARAPAPICRRCVRTARSSRAAASRRARCRSCGSTTRLRPWSRAAARPAAPPRCSRSRTGIPT